jgi:hypothetical protein
MMARLAGGLMSIEDQIPSMGAKELENLRDNALRLSKSGAPKQQAEAARLLPIIESAIVTAKSAAAAATVEKKKARSVELAEARAKKASRKAAEKAAMEADDEEAEA